MLLPWVRETIGGAFMPLPPPCLVLTVAGPSLSGIQLGPLGQKVPVGVSRGNTSRAHLVAVGDWLCLSGW